MDIAIVVLFALCAFFLLALRELSRRIDAMGLGEINIEVINDRIDSVRRDVFNLYREQRKERKERW